MRPPAAGVLAGTTNSPWPDFPLFLLVGSGVLAVAVVILLVALRRAPSTTLGSLRARSPGTPFRQRVADAREFSRAVGPRVLPSILELFAGCAMAAGVVMAICALIAFGPLWLAPDFWGPFTLEQWPLPVRIGGGLAAWAVTFIAAGAALGCFRIVGIARSTGHAPRAGVLGELGRAFETIGFFATAGVAGATVLILGTAAFGVYELTEVIRRIAPAPPEAPLAGALVLVGAFLWLFVFVPTVFVLPILARRDCGWSRALGASASLFALEPADVLRSAVLFTVWTASIFRLPAALHLLLSMFDGRERLLQALVLEKSPESALATLEESLAATPAALERPYRLLESRDYLGALNAFQMYLHKNREDVAGMRGECHAMLRLGHTIKAREKLERWQRHAPDDPEPTRLLGELAAGQWEPPHGPAFLNATGRGSPARAPRE